MHAIRPRKLTSIRLLTSIFNTADIVGQAGRQHKTMQQCVRDTLKNQNFDIQMPIEIKTADEYVTLFESAFNAATLNLTANNKAPTPKAVELQAEKLIEFLKGQNVIKVATKLQQEIY